MLCHPRISSPGLFALLLAVAAPAAAHVGGLVVQPQFLSPVGIIEPVEPSVDVLWIDGDADPTGVLHFHTQLGNVPPVPIV